MTPSGSRRRRRCRDTTEQFSPDFLANSRMLLALASSIWMRCRRAFCIGDRFCRSWNTSRLRYAIIFRGSFRVEKGTLSRRDPWLQARGLPRSPRLSSCIPLLQGGGRPCDLDLRARIAGPQSLPLRPFLRDCSSMSAH